MKHTKLSVAILLTTILIGCKKGENIVVPTVDPLIDKPILITTNTQNNYPTMEFGVTVTNTKSSKYTYLNNKLSLDSTGVAWRPETEMLWEDSPTNVAVVAYYPYAYNLDTTTNILINRSVRFDQSTAEGIKASDFLYYSDDNVTPSITGIPISFTHALAKVNIKISLTPEVDTEVGANPISNINLLCAKALFNWDLETNTVTPQGIITPATPLEGPYTINAGNTVAIANYEAILVPQLVPATSFNITFNINNTPYTWSSTKEINLIQNRAYVLNLAITTDQKVEAIGDITEVDWVMN